MFDLWKQKVPLGIRTGVYTALFCTACGLILDLHVWLHAGFNPLLPFLFMFNLPAIEVVDHNPHVWFLDYRHVLVSTVFWWAPFYGIARFRLRRKKRKAAKESANASGAEEVHSSTPE